MLGNLISMVIIFILIRASFQYNILVAARVMIVMVRGGERGRWPSRGGVGTGCVQVVSPSTV